MNENKNELYLTSSLEPLSTGKKVKKYVFKPILIILVILVVLGALGYFVLFPLYMKYLFRNPKIVFSKALDTLSSKVDDVVSTNNNKIIFDEYELSLESDFDILKDYSGYKINLNSGINKDSKDFDLIAKFNGTDLLKYYERDSKNYLVSNEYYMSYEGSTKYFDLLRDSYYSDTNAMIKEMISLLKSKLTDDRLSYEDETIDVCGKKVEVVRYTINLSTEDLNELLNIAGINKKLEGENKVSFNLYTEITDGVGFDLEINGFRLFYLYGYEDKSDMYLDLSDIVGSNVRFRIYTNDENKVMYSLNGADYGCITYNDDDSLINLNYTLNVLGKIKGNGAIKLVTGDNTSFDFSFNTDKKYLNVNFRKVTSSNYSFEEVDSEKVIPYDKALVSNMISNNDLYKIYLGLVSNDDENNQIQEEASNSDVNS